MLFALWGAHARSEPVIGSAGLLTRVILTDNLFLTRQGKEDGGVLQLLPNVSGGKSTSRSSYRFYYGPSLLVYGGGYSDLNRVFQVLQADATVQLIGDYLGVQASARANQNLVNPDTYAVGFDALGNPDAFAQTASFQIAPIIRFPLLRSDVANVQITPGVNYVWGANSGDPGSNDNGSYGGQSSISVTSGDYFQRLRWSIDGYSDVFRLGNDDSGGANANQGYSNITGTLYYPLTPRWEIQGLVGYETGEYESTSSTSGWQWRITPYWTPSQNATIGLGYGYRYFGPDYFADIQYRYKKTALSFTYETTVSNARTAVANGDIVQFQDAFGQPIYAPLDNQLLSGSVSNPPLVNGMYVQNQMNASIVHIFGRTTAALSIMQDHWEYQENDLQIDQTQGNLNLSRSLSPSSTASLGVQFWTYNQSEASGADFNQYQLSAQWQHLLKPGLTSSIGYYYSRRSSDSPFQDYDQNQVWLTLTYTRLRR